MSLSGSRCEWVSFAFRIVVAKYVVNGGVMVFVVVEVVSGVELRCVRAVWK